MSEQSGNIVLEVESLNIGFLGKPILSDVSFNCLKGKTLGIIGPSGSGKSLLTTCILQMNPPYLQCTAQKFQLYYQNQSFNLLEKQNGIRGKLVSIVFQDNYSVFNPIFTIGEQLLEVLLLHENKGKETAIKEIENWLNKVQLFDTNRILKAYPHQLSGGQRQRILIVMALLSNPVLLIADEPTTALDDENKEIILRLLQDLQKEFAFSLILISHDQSVIEKYADNILDLNKPNIHISDFTILKNKIDTNKKVVEISHLSFKYAEESELIIHDLSLTLFENQFVGIFGNSGTGKSTFIKLLVGLENPIEGTIKYKHENIPIQNYRQIVFQDATSALNPRLSIKEILSDTLNTVEEMFYYLELVGLPQNYLEKYPHQLSGGEKQRISIARSLSMQPRLLICDEIIASLDKKLQYQLLQMLKELQQKLVFSILFISHDIKIMELFCDKLYELKEGKLLENKKGI